MKRLREAMARFGGLFNKRRKDRDLDEEIESHLQLHADDNLRLGMTPEEARREALRKLGGIVSAKEAYRDQRGLPWLEMFWQDIRYGARMLGKNPGFTAVAVLTLALGIGANTAIFTVINTVLLRSLPVRDPNELVQVVITSESPQPSYELSYPCYEQLRDGARSLSGLFAAGGVVVKDRLLIPSGHNAQTEFVRAQAVSGNFFSVLGVPALIGRTFAAEDDRAGHPQAVAVISHSFWQLRFGGEASVVGKSVNFNGAAFTIVGVTPPGFFGFQPGETPDLWWPLQMSEIVPPGGWLKEGTSWLRLVGRLAPGIQRNQAEAELRVVFQRYQEAFAASRMTKWRAEFRQGYFGQRLELWGARAGWTSVRDQLRQPLLILMAIVAVVLLITCANVASLLLARAAARQREFSIRSALGAGRFRLVRQLLIESLLLAALGGALGLVFAQGGMQVLQFVIRLRSDPISLSLSPDARVLFFTTVVALLTGLLFGLAPALRCSRLDVVTALKDSTGSVAGSATRHGFLQALVMAQVGLSLILLVGAGLFVRTLHRLKGQDSGFNTQRVVLFNVDFVDNPDEARLTTFHKEVLTRLGRIPGARAASLFNFGLLSGNYWTADVLAEGYQLTLGENLKCSGMMVGAGFFETFGIPLLSGRSFERQDERPPDATIARPKTAVINQAFARRYFGDANPIGRRLYLVHEPEKKIEILGVVADAKYQSLRAVAPPTIYTPFFRQESGATFALRTSTAPRAMMASLQGVVHEVDPTVRVRDLRTMDDVVNTSVHQERLIAQFGGFFSLFALALSCLGLYGVLSFAVVQRSREIGLRMALGAQRRDVLFLVIGKGLKLILVGAVFGLAGGMTATRLVSNLLYGVTPTDPLTLGCILLLLTVVAVLASWLPARRAARLDPMAALRCE